MWYINEHSLLQFIIASGVQFFTTLSPKNCSATADVATAIKTHEHEDSTTNPEKEVLEIQQN